MCGKSKITYEEQNKTEMISQCGEFLVVNTFSQCDSYEYININTTTEQIQILIQIFIM